MEFMDKKRAICAYVGAKQFFRVEDPRASVLIGDFLAELFPPQKPEIEKEIIFLGVGSDRSTGDSLGPLVGSCLKELGIKQDMVLGTLEKPVHAVNLKTKLEFIEHNFKNPFVVAVDAALGRLKNVGQIKIEEGPLFPGAAVNKVLPRAGDIHITGTVNVSGCLEYLVLQNTRLSLVVNLARTISWGIYLGLTKTGFNQATK